MKKLLLITVLLISACSSPESRLERLSGNYIINFASNATTTYNYGIYAAYDCNGACVIEKDNFVLWARIIAGADSILDIRYTSSDYEIVAGRIRLNDRSSKELKYTEPSSGVLIFTDSDWTLTYKTLYTSKTIMGID